jgi:hypothetical protein
MTYPDGIDALVNVNAIDTLAGGGHAARHNSVNTALGEVKDFLGTGTGYRYNSTVYFTSNGTFTKADYPWLRAIRVRLVGGGGGGGGVAATASTTASAGTGGGGGGYAERFYTNVSSLGASVSVTVGAGGAANSGAAGGGGGVTEFGTSGDPWRTRATGGTGGSFFGPSTAPDARPGVDGGAGSHGELLTNGRAGSDCLLLAITGLRIVSGNGGDSQLSGGPRGRGVNIDSGADGGAGSTGSGGGGAVNLGTQASARPGGAGGAGIVIVELYA